jgi:uncharacterized membrane protein
MDPQLIAITIVIIIFFISIGFFSYILTFVLGEIAVSYNNKKKTERFNPLLLKLLEQKPPTKDVIDLFKSVFNISDKNEPTFVSKIIVSLEDFKTWKLEMEYKSIPNHLTSSQSQEWRTTINNMIEEINVKYPFADLKPENKIFFEDFKKFIDNREFEACRAKLVELSKIFSGQNKELENMAKQTRYAYYLSIAGIIIGLCGFILPFLLI